MGVIRYRVSMMLPSVNLSACHCEIVGTTVAVNSSGKCLSHKSGNQRCLTVFVPHTSIFGP